MSLLGARLVYNMGHGGGAGGWLFPAISDTRGLSSNKRQAPSVPFLGFSTPELKDMSCRVERQSAEQPVKRGLSVCGMKGASTPLGKRSFGSLRKGGGKKEK